MLPFAALAIVATAAVALVALSVTSSALSSHIRRDVVDATRVVSRGGFATTPGILSAIRQMTGAEVVTFDTAGLVATTLDPSAQADLVQRVISGGRALALGDAPVEQQLENAPPYYVAYSKVADRPDTVVALLLENSEMNAATRRLTGAILGGAFLSLALTIVVGQFVARRVSNPISTLARFADTVSSPGDHGRAPVGDDEVGRLGAAFNHMLERLEQAQGAVVRSEKLALAGLFAARVAHDVRNPLSSLKLQAQLIHAHAAPGSDERSMAEAMLLDIDQVEFVVTNLLDLAREVRLQRSPAAINALIEGVLRQVAPQCTHRHIAVSRHLAPDLPLVPLDPDRMTQALRNVIVNAVEALRERGTLAVWSHLSADGREVIVDVDDDGVGLDPEAARRAFDPFVSTKPDGVGLGLVNARSVVEGHGGTITLEPRRPAGTRATIRIPLEIGNTNG